MLNRVRHTARGQHNPKSGASRNTRRRETHSTATPLALFARSPARTLRAMSNLGVAAMVAAAEREYALALPRWGMQKPSGCPMKARNFVPGCMLGCPHPDWTTGSPQLCTKFFDLHPSAESHYRRHVKQLVSEVRRDKEISTKRVGSRRSLVFGMFSSCGRSHLDMSR
jgi:hypothetical protein